jgi:hypothetical protein
MVGERYTHSADRINRYPMLGMKVQEGARETYGGRSRSSGWRFTLPVHGVYADSDGKERRTGPHPVKKGMLAASGDRCEGGNTSKGKVWLEQTASRV